MQNLTMEWSIIPNILSTEQIHTILYGDICWKHQVSRTRTIQKKYRGTSSVLEDLRYFNWVQLPDGRIDINIPHGLHCLIPIPDNVLQMFPGYTIVHINLLVTPSGAQTQQWHQDNGKLSLQDYYTILIPLNYSPGMGKTQLVVPYKHKLPKDPVFTEPHLALGDGLCFSGALWHRGTANMSNDTRYCIYLIISRRPEMTVEGWR